MIRFRKLGKAYIKSSFGEFEQNMEKKKTLRGQELNPTAPRARILMHDHYYSRMRLATLVRI